MEHLRTVFVIMLCSMQLWNLEASAVQEFQDWDGLKEALFNTEYSMVDFFASW